MNNWDHLVKAIVPLTFLAIWALTSLFNRESKTLPAKSAGGPPTGPRPGEPTMRWTPVRPSENPGPGRGRTGEDDVLVITNDSMRAPRTLQPRPTPASGSRRPNRSRSPIPPSRKPEAPSVRPKLGGVTQNVNQQLANPVGMTALTALAPMPGAVVSNLTEAPASPSKTETPGLTVATIGPLMNNPLRLREAFLVNELLQPPLALRKRHNPRL